MLSMWVLCGPKSPEANNGAVHVGCVPQADKRNILISNSLNLAHAPDAGKSCILNSHSASQGCLITAIGKCNPLPANQGFDLVSRTRLLPVRDSVIFSRMSSEV